MDRNLVVLDRSNYRIQILDLDGNWKSQFGKQAQIDPPEFGCFNYPCGLAIDNQGKIYVSDETNCNIQVFSPSGQFLMRFGDPGSEPGNLNAPIGLAITFEGNLVVCERENTRVQIFSPTGESIKTIGDTPGGMASPWGVTVDKNGTIAVADSGTFKTLLLS